MRWRGRLHHGVEGHAFLTRGRIASSPSTGPGTSSKNAYCTDSHPMVAFSSSMLGMVMAKPMQLAMVSAEPTSPGGA